MQSEKIILRHTFSEMVEAYKDKGIKGLFESIADKEVVIIEEEQVAEEATNDEFKAELKDAIDKSLGKKKAKVADAAVQAVEVQKEEVEQLDELSLNTKVNAFAKRYSKDDSPEGYDKAMKTLSHIKKHEGGKGVIKAITAGERASHEDPMTKREKEKIAYRKEEVEQIDELSTEKLAQYKKAAGASASAADKAGNFELGNKRFKGINTATKKQFANATKVNEDVEQIEEAHSVLYKMKKDAKKISVAHYPSKEDAQKFLDDIKTKGGNGIVRAKISEEIELDERHLTADEKAEMEKNVKGMKKNLSSFKDRYGDRAKEVMYATATKQAKED